MQNYKDQLRLDKRLLKRQGWITPGELEKELAALPDVSEKAETAEIDPPAPADSAEE